MGARRTEYRLIGKYRKGNSIVAYQLQNTSNNSSSKFSREQVIYLVGRGQVLNCIGQLNGDGVILRGNGINMEELPTITLDSNGNISFRIVAEIKDAHKRTGFVVEDGAGNKKPLNINSIAKLVKESRISNAELRRLDSGQVEIVGTNGTNLTALPSVSYKF